MPSSSGPVSAVHPEPEFEPASGSTRPVVVGVGADQPELLDQAFELAQAFETPLRVVHAYWRKGGSAATHMGQDAPKDLREAALRVLDDARGRLADRATENVSYELVFARPVDAIQAESENATLVVLGTDHAGWFNRVTGREIARHAALHARCPVAVVPAGRPMTSGDIVAAIDIDNVSQDALGVAVDLSARMGELLRVLSVVQAGLTDPGLGRQRARLDQAVHRWRVKFPRVDIRTEVIPADTVSALTKITDDARMMVIGRPNELQLALAFSPPVASSLLRTTSCPLVIVPIARRRRPRPEMS